MSVVRLLIGLLLTVVVLLPAAQAQEPNAPAPPRWVGPMKTVRAKFTGGPGTFAMFGDSITVSLAFWAPLAQDPKTLSPDGRAALARVNAYMRAPCWRDWRGPAFGSDGGKTMAWADEHVDGWLKELNPEVVLLMFGTNDLTAGGSVADYAAATRRVVQRCLDNGSVVILTTIPPRSGHESRAAAFAKTARAIADDIKLPLIDYHAEILKRRPNDWDGSKPPFKVEAGGDVYDVATLISADGVHPSAPQKHATDFSDEGLSRHGYNLRSHLTLLTYAEVIDHVLDGRGR